MFVLLVVFALYVRSVPPAEPRKLEVPQFQGGVPNFVNVETAEPMVKEALDEAAEVLKKMEEEGGAEEEGAEEKPVEETIEL